MTAAIAQQLDSAAAWRRVDQAFDQFIAAPTEAQQHAKPEHTMALAGLTSAIVRNRLAGIVGFAWTAPVLSGANSFAEALR